ncbi:hypothetical protein [Alkalihalobacillus sp. BA299]|uniref:hypothetical protein n=1 Tax=Alkalihalobacillus sp. BA299 TaxID=2815938 RepID=UPI001ADBA06F|nr:hypothetical protein [Alkalihalobacillus sp. BA299]
MFKITCFIEHSPEKLSAALTGLHFQNKKEGFIWSVDGHIFRIEPFKYQGRATNSYGYRVYFDGSIDGGIYLFDLSMGFLNPKVTGVEYNLYHQNRDKNDWLKDLNSRKSYQKSDTLGIYRKGNVGVVVLDDCVNLQIRATKKRSLKLIECLKQIDMIQEEIKPVEYDLFSILEEGVAI